MEYIRHVMYMCDLAFIRFVYFYSRKLPSSFLSNKTKKPTGGTVSKLFTYDRDIICDLASKKALVAFLQLRGKSRSKVSITSYIGQYAFVIATDSRLSPTS